MQIWGLSDNSNIYTYLNIIRVSCKVSLTKAQPNMMICSLELVLSVKGKITRLSVSLLCLSVSVSLLLPKEEKTREERERDFTDGGIELEEWEKKQVMGKGFEEQEMESISQLCRKDNSSSWQFFKSFISVIICKCTYICNNYNNT